MFIFKLIPSRILSRQARRPSGFIGRYIMSHFFKIGNADLNLFVKESLQLKTKDQVLEVGFGPGILINEMAKITTEGMIEGIDFSDAMLKQATQYNKQNINKKKVRLQKYDSVSLPFNDNNFHKICSVNTLYFWKKPKTYLTELLRVLKPGGKIVIGFRDNQQMSNLNLSEDIFNTYSQDEVIGLLSNAGFSSPQLAEKEGIPFISYCAIATKPLDNVKTNEKY